MLICAGNSEGLSLELRECQEMRLGRGGRQMLQHCEKALDSSG